MMDNADTEPPPAVFTNNNTAGYYEYESPIDEVSSPSQPRQRISRRVNNITSDAIDSETLQLHRGRLLLYSTPYQRQKWGDTQVLPHKNWSDLLFDLFYVAATYNVSFLLTDSPDGTGLLYAAGTFLPIMGVWTQRTFFDSRFVFEGNDLFHRFTVLIKLCILGVAVLHVRSSMIHENGSEKMVFSLMLMLTQLYAMGQNLEVYFKGVGQRKQIRGSALREGRLLCFTLAFYMAAFVVAAVQYFGQRNKDHSRSLAASLSPARHIPIVLILLGYVLFQLIFAVTVIFYFPNDGSHKELIVPLNIDFTIHRNGEWTMLMLGESVFSLLIVQVDQASSSFNSVFFFGVLTIIFLQILHFQSQPHHADDHASRRDKNAGILLSLVWHAYSLALVTLGAAFTFFLTLSEDYATGHRLLAESKSSSSIDLLPNASHLFSGTMAAIYVSLDISTLLHLGEKEALCRLKRAPRKGAMLIILRFGVIVFIATLSQWNFNPERLALCGFLSVLAQLVLRKLGLKCLTRQAQKEHGDKGKKRIELAARSTGAPIRTDSETGESRWPNVTHARAELSDEVKI